MKEFVCQKNSSGRSSPFVVRDCLGSRSRRLSSSDSISEKTTQVEYSALIRRQVV